MLIQRAEKSRVRDFRAVHAVESKVQLFAVMRVEAEISEIHRAVSAFFQVAYRVGISQALAHLAVVDQHKVAVHPVIDRLFTRDRFVLCYLVLVVNGDMVYAARMDIEREAQIFAAERRALYMPARISHSPRTFPLHYMVGFSLFPYREVCGMALLAVHLYSRACLLFVEIKARQLAVTGELAYVVINAVVYLVRIAFIDEFLNVSYRFGDMIGYLFDYLGSSDIQLFEIFEEYARVKLRYLVRRFFLFARSLLHLVFALVLIAGKVTDVGNVHNAFELIAVVFQHATEKIHEHVRSQVAYMRKAVYGGSAAVHADLTLFYRFEILFFSRKSIVYFQHKISSPQSGKFILLYLRCRWLSNNGSF